LAVPFYLVSFGKRIFKNLIEMRQSVNFICLLMAGVIASSCDNPKVTTDASQAEPIDSAQIQEPRNKDQKEKIDGDFLLTNGIDKIAGYNICLKPFKEVGDTKWRLNFNIIEVKANGEVKDEKYKVVELTDKVGVDLYMLNKGGKLYFHAKTVGGIPSSGWKTKPLHVKGASATIPFNAFDGKLSRESPLAPEKPNVPAFVGANDARDASLTDFKCVIANLDTAKGAGARRTIRLTYKLINSKPKLLTSVPEANEKFVKKAMTVKKVDAGVPRWACDLKITVP
jgi:hypothetical protein